VFTKAFLLYPENWPLTLMKKYTLRMFENIVLMRVSGSERGKST
jgi:hypothetical protein